MRNNPLLGPYGRSIPRVLWWSYWGGLFLLSEVPLYCAARYRAVWFTNCAVSFGRAMCTARYKCNNPPYKPCAPARPTDPKFREQFGEKATAHGIFWTNYIDADPDVGPPPAFLRSS
jgi:hypothetical protein